MITPRKLKTCVIFSELKLSDKKGPLYAALFVFKNKNPRLKSVGDLIYSLIKLNNLSPYIQGWGNFVCKDDLSFSGTYTILSVGTVNAKASAILKVVGSIFGSGFNSYLVQVSFSVDVNENYSNLEVTAIEEFNSTEVLNRITQLENKLNEITISETN